MLQSLKQRPIGIIILLPFVNWGLLICGLSSCDEKKTNKEQPVNTTTSNAVAAIWTAPDTSKLGNTEQEQLIKYGKKLIENTAYYLGPKGTIAKISNGMNCQNCHLAAGTKAFGNNYSAVAANYPKFRGRSGMVEDIYKRVNDCIERSLNGKGLDTAAHEMQAIKAYIEWLGAGVPKGTKPAGAGITELAYLDQKTDPANGKIVYVQKCRRCHGENGEGKMNPDNITYQYPPLWGKHSYNNGAGLFRISSFAGYVKSNMPFGTNYDNPQLSDEEAWNVAAFVISQPRPAIDLSKDWPDISLKPVDYPFGPYKDTFNEAQHKYGPFLAIAEAKKKPQKQ